MGSDVIVQWKFVESGHSLGSQENDASKTGTYQNHHMKM